MQRLTPLLLGDPSGWWHFASARDHTYILQVHSGSSGLRTTGSVIRLRRLGTDGSRSLVVVFFGPDSDMDTVTISSLLYGCFISESQHCVFNHRGWIDLDVRRMPVAEESGAEVPYSTDRL